MWFIDLCVNVSVTAISEDTAAAVQTAGNHARRPAAVVSRDLEDRSIRLAASQSNP